MLKKFQYADLEAETEEFREHARKIFEAKTHEIDQLQAKIKDLEERLCYPATGEQTQRIKTSDSESVASSPISYLWNQSTIQVPTRDYQNPNWNRTNKTNDDNNPMPADDDDTTQNLIAPIRRPQTPSTSAATTLKNSVIENSENIIDNTTEILDDVLSLRSFGTHSIASTHSMYVFFLNSKFLFFSFQIHLKIFAFSIPLNLKMLLSNQSLKYPFNIS